MGSGRKGQIRNTEDITGQKFERLTALRAVGSKYSQAGAMLGKLWECQCECGNLRTVLRKHLGRVTKECESCVLARRPHNLRGYKRRPTYTPIMASVRVKMGLYQRKRRAKCRKFALTVQQAYSLFTGTCYYCGVAPDLTGPTIPTSRLNGIDRVDPQRDYEADNCVSCCKYCNYAKNDMTTDQFFSLVSRIAKQHNL
jgi:5-methylcytosine-specific restriction endonuclease McrA